MQVEFVHGNDLAVAATGSPTLNTKRRPLARLADVGKHGFAQVRAQSLRETNGCRRLALAQWGGRDTSLMMSEMFQRERAPDEPGHDDVFAVPARPRCYLSQHNRP
jgi:hypothetical protein